MVVVMGEVGVAAEEEEEVAAAATCVVAAAIALCQKRAPKSTV